MSFHLSVRSLVRLSLTSTGQLLLLLRLKKKTSASARRILSGKRRGRQLQLCLKKNCTFFVFQVERQPISIIFGTVTPQQIYNYI